VTDVSQRGWRDSRVNVIVDTLFARSSPPLKPFKAAIAPLLGFGLVVGGGAAVGVPAQAQPSGAVERRFQDQQLRDELRQLEQQQERIDQEQLITPASPEEKEGEQEAVDSQALRLERLEIKGMAALPQSVVQDIEKEFVGQPITSQLLNRLRQRVLAAYEQKRLLALVAPAVESSGGVVRVEVLEARLGAVEVRSNNSSIRSGWAIAMVQSALHPGSVIRLDKLESALIKLNDLSGLKATATMKPGQQSGTSNVVLTMEGIKRWNTALNLNNELSQYTGVAQLEGSSSAASLLGRGDQWSLSYALGGDETGYGVRRLLGSADVPLTADGLRVLGSVGWSDYRLLEELAADDLKGSTRSFNVGIRQPLWRRPRRSVFAQLGYDQYRSQDWVAGVEYSNRVNHAARATAVMTQQDKFLGSGINSAVLIGSVGYLDKSANAFEQAVDDALGQTAGNWGKLQLILTRMQLFKDSPYSLEIFAQGQKALNNLGSEEKFSMGWPNGVRAYPPGEASGDSGASLQLTLRRKIGTKWMAKVFVDAAYVWRWTEAFEGQQSPNSFGLWGPGFGVDYGEYGKAMISANVGFPIGDNPNLPTGFDADGLNPSVRVWLSGKVWL